MPMIKFLNSWIKAFISLQHPTNRCTRVKNVKDGVLDVFFKLLVGSIHEVCQKCKVGCPILGKHFRRRSILTRSSNPLCASIQSQNGIKMESKPFEAKRSKKRTRPHFSLGGPGGNTMVVLQATFYTHSINSP